MSATAAPPRARIPSLPRRLIGGAVLMVPLIVFWVGLPAVLLQELGSRGVGSSLGIETVSIAGLVISLLGAARYVVKPTRAYGPVTLLTAVSVSAYLLAIIPFANFSLTIDGSLNLTLNYAPLLLLLAIIPGFAAVAGMLVTVEDGLAPGERLPFDYPP